MIWVRPYKPKKFTGIWEYHIKFTRPDGTEVEERKRSPFPTDKQKTERYAKRREAELLEQALRPRKATKQHVPTFSEWRERYIAACRADHFKGATCTGKDSYWNRWLKDIVGDLALDDLTPEHVCAIKIAMNEAGRKGKTVNNVLDELRAMLNAAIEQKVIASAPCKIRGVKVDRHDVTFYAEHEIESLLNATADEQHVAVLLGAHAGLRRAEICGLMWCDVDFAGGKIRVCRTLGTDEGGDGEGGGGELVEGSTKSRKPRTVPMSKRLAAALRAHRHLRGPRVIYEVDGGELNGGTVTEWLRDAERAAGLAPAPKPVHKLRHTFASVLALRGVPGRVIQELCGHHSLTVTQKYLHLAPDSTAAAVSVFDRPVGAPGDIRETADHETVTA